MKWKTISLLVLSYFLILLVKEWPDNKLRIVFCDVGQGDGTVISKNYFQVIIDAADLNQMLSCVRKVMPFWDRKIELVIISHGQIDHYGGIRGLLERYEVGTLVASGLGADEEEWDKLRGVVSAKGIRVWNPRAGDRIRLGEVELDLLWPQERMANEYSLVEKERNKPNLRDWGADYDLNRASVVVEVRLGEFGALFTGDLGQEEERKLVEQGLVGDVVVLKVGHHGSRFSSSSEFLAVVKPEVAVISVGKNSFGHPTEETLERLKGVGARIYRTDVDGDVVVVSDGKRWWVEKE